MRNVNILGTKYKVKEKKINDCDGYHDPSINEIVVGRFEKKEGSLENLEAYKRKVLRHEVIHAFLYQSGLDINSEKAWARNEEMVDYFAIQIPKIYKAFKELNIDEI